MFNKILLLNINKLIIYILSGTPSPPYTDILDTLSKCQAKCCMIKV